MSSSSNRHGGDGGEVRASDILVKHQGSRRKASWNDTECQIIKKTTRNSAVFQVKAFHDDILSGKAKFEDIASRFSDCNSAKCAGDLGSPSLRIIPNLTRKISVYLVEEVKSVVNISYYV
ncbi:hypothetical protein Ahy_A06g029895 [Arachis hypogaea]|uniref:Peptidyl-prolyl cis-trans isomerase n=1 Tax=Arachis hypogaea TaxID=3818 RepID=A0A445CUJ3_ARAHY|nr:hypothetical protein Ahy_A06g029895 [Arachis hypogaea]